MPLPNAAALERPTEYELPYDLLAYEHWLRERNVESSAKASYLFLEPRVRFFPEPDDSLTLVSGVSLRSEGTRAVLVHGATGTQATLEGLTLPLVERMIGAINGQRSVIAVQLTASASLDQMDAFLRASFGRFVLCPDTLNAYESRLPACGLVRFPGSPYELNRYYWANMAAVRETWQTTLTCSVELRHFVRCLKQLHVIALIGKDGRSFYRPSSPIVNKAGARAGTFYDVPTRTLQDLDLCLFIDGPRVSAPFVGGRRYHELIARTLGDPDALLPEREIIDKSGLSWGRVTVGQSREDSAPAAWFIPPRPITLSHLEQLYRKHREALSREVFSLDEWLRRISDFHYDFVRLHPFTCANQSLAMNLVNGLLERGKYGPIPHLILDQFALRLSREAYTQLFRRVVGAWSLESLQPSERQRKHIEQRTQLDRLVSQVGQAPSLAVAEGVMKDEPAAARLALLTDD